MAVVTDLFVDEGSLLIYPICYIQYLTFDPGQWSNVETSTRVDVMWCNFDPGPRFILPRSKICYENLRPNIWCKYALYNIWLSTLVEGTIVNFRPGFKFCFFPGRRSVMRIFDPKIQYCHRVKSLYGVLSTRVDVAYGETSTQLQGIFIPRYIFGGRRSAIRIFDPIYGTCILYTILDFRPCWSKGFCWPFDLGSSFFPGRRYALSNSTTIYIYTSCTLYGVKVPQSRSLTWERKPWTWVEGPPYKHLTCQVEGPQYGPWTWHILYI
jgi:hypothetical protein